MTRRYFTLDDFDLEGKTVIVRIDINSPLNPETGAIKNDKRIRSHVDTLKELKKSKVVLLAHQSRPGKKDFVSLREHAKRLSELLKKEVKFVDDIYGERAVKAIKSLKKGEILLLENVRFDEEELALKRKTIERQSKCQMVKTLAPLADFFVNDAFSSGHRSQPSIVGFPYAMPSIAGRVMEKEIKAIRVWKKCAKKPCVALLGGAKVDDSIHVATNLLKKGKADKILTSGVVGNIMLLAKGVELDGGSMTFIKEHVDDWEKLVANAKKLVDETDDAIVTPKDVAIDKMGHREEIDIDALPSQYPVVDIGKETARAYRETILSARSIFLNGPAGIFEQEQFAFGTKEIFQAVADSEGYSIVGGGETAAAASEFGMDEKMSHVSTGGGALINFLSGQRMPVVEALRTSRKRYEEGVYEK